MIKRTPYLDGVQEAEHSIRRVIEGRLPLREGLETVHHTTIIANSRGGDQAEGL